MKNDVMIRVYETSGAFFSDANMTTGFVICNSINWKMIEEKERKKPDYNESKRIMTWDGIELRENAEYLINSSKEDGITNKNIQMLIHRIEINNDAHIFVQPFVDKNLIIELKAYNADVKSLKSFDNETNEYLSYIGIGEDVFVKDAFSRDELDAMEIRKFINDYDISDCYADELIEKIYEKVNCEYEKKYVTSVQFGDELYEVEIDVVNEDNQKDILLYPVAYNKSLVSDYYSIYKHPNKIEIKNFNLDSVLSFMAKYDIDGKPFDIAKIIADDINNNGNGMITYINEDCKISYRFDPEGKLVYISPSIFGKKNFEHEILVAAEDFG